MERWIVTPPIVSVQDVEGGVTLEEVDELVLEEEEIEEARVRGCEGRNEGRERLGERT